MTSSSSSSITKPRRIVGTAHTIWVRCTLSGRDDDARARPVTAPRDPADRVAEELLAARRHITELEAELQALRAELAAATGSASARIALSLARRARRVVPPESRRQETLHRTASRTLTLVDKGPSALAGLIRRDREL